MEKENKDKVNNQGSKSGYKALPLVFEIGGIIAFPVMILGVVGRLLDNRLGSSPLFLIAAIVTSLIISGILIYRKVRKVLDQTDQDVVE